MTFWITAPFKLNEISSFIFKMSSLAPQFAEMFIFLGVDKLFLTPENSIFVELNLKYAFLSVSLAEMFILDKTN